MCVTITHQEFEQRKRRLDKQLAAGIAMLREGHRAQVRALERVRRTGGEVYEEIAAVLSQLPAEFNKNDVLRALGRPASRVSLFRAEHD
jgi:hypothetical protein